jgi:tetratricopeptide (TPR) repeat protein
MEGYAKEPDNIHLLEKLFLSHQKLGNYDQAVAMIEQYPDQLLKNPYIMDYYLDHLVNSSQIARAEEVIETYPREGEFTGDLKDNTLKDRYRARLAVLQGDYSSAMTIYKRLDSADALQDYHLIPYLEIAVIQKDWTVANSLIEKMSSLDHEDFYLHAARAYLFQGDDTRAVNYANRVTTPLKLAHLWRDFGDYYENSGNKARARDAYSRSLKYVGLDF